MQSRKRFLSSERNAAVLAVETKLLCHPQPRADRRGAGRDALRVPATQEDIEPEAQDGSDLLRHSNRPREPEQEVKNSDNSNADRLPAIEPENQIMNVKIATASSFSEDDKPEENGAIRKPMPKANTRQESSKSAQPHSTSYPLVKPLNQTRQSSTYGTIPAVGSKVVSAQAGLLPSPPKV